MKIVMLILLFSSVILAPVVNAGSGPNAESHKTAIVENLTRGVDSDNEGLRISAAIVIKQVIDNNIVHPDDFSSSLIPLLKMLDNGTTSNERMSAALTLYSLDNGIGIYKLRGSAKFDASKKVRTISKNLYYGYHTIHNSTYFLDF